MRGKNETTETKTKKSRINNFNLIIVLDMSHGQMKLNNPRNKRKKNLSKLRIPHNSTEIKKYTN